MNKKILQQQPEYLDHVTSLGVPYPTALNIELTTYCNLRCIMCPKTSGIARTPANQRISDTILDKILTQVLPHVFRVDLVGDGEILLEAAKLERVLTAAREHHVMVNASTNAVLLNEKLAEMLVKNGLHDLNISLDAARTDTYAEIRGADLNRVLSNIEILNTIKKQENSLFPRLQFSMVGMERNIEELPELVELAARYQAKAVMIQAMGEFEEVKNESIYLRNREKGQYWLDKGKSVAEQNDIALNLWPDDQFSNETNSESSTKQMPASHIPQKTMKDCSFPWEVPYFATDGSVRPCCAMPSMGSMETQSFDDIWSGRKYTDLRRQLNSFHPPAECIVCPGRGWFTPIECKDHLVPGRDDRQFGTGWFETESYKGEYYRWARDKGVFFVSGEGPGVLSVEIHTVWDPGTTRNFTVQIDDDPERPIAFNYGERRRVLLPFTDTRNIHRVIIAGDTWRPVLTVPGELDPRALSVMFYGAEILARGSKIEFSNRLIVWGWTIQQNVKNELTFRFYLDLSEITEPLHLFLHAFPESKILPGRVNKLLHETLLKLPVDIKRSQADCPVQNQVPDGELQVLECNLVIQEPLLQGDFSVFLGVSDSAGARVPPLGDNRHLYRSAVRIYSSSEQD